MFDDVTASIEALAQRQTELLATHSPERACVHRPPTVGVVERTKHLTSESKLSLLLLSVRVAARSFEFFGQQKMRKREETTFGPDDRTNERTRERENGRRTSYPQGTPQDSEAAFTKYTIS